MRKFFAVALGSVVALAGFAGTANASATVDLIWIDITSPAGCMLPANRNCDRLGTTLSNVAVTDNVTLLVLLTAGPLGSWGGGVSVNYGDTIAGYSVTNFSSKLTKKPLQYLPLFVGTTTDQPPYIDNVNAAAQPALSLGLGLPASGSAYLGTVVFHKDLVVNGTFEITVGTDGPGNTDGILNGLGGDATPTLNSAYLVNVPEPGALSLLVMGVGGMLLAGRGRRS
jgi:hypothetical protein